MRIFQEKSERTLRNFSLWWVYSYKKNQHQMLSTQQLVLMHSLGFSCIADAHASYVQAHLNSGPSYKKDSTVRAETPPHSALQRNIHNGFFCPRNKAVIRFLDFIISIAKSIRGGEGAQKACHVQKKNKKSWKTLHCLLGVADTYE